MLLQKIEINFPEVKKCDSRRAGGPGLAIPCPGKGIWKRRLFCSLCQPGSATPTGGGIPSMPCETGHLAWREGQGRVYSSHHDAERMLLADAAKPSMWVWS